MKTKQKSVRVFEINSDNYDKVVGLIESKSILLKKYLLLVKTNNEKIKEYFKTKNLEVRFVSKDFNGINDKLEIIEEKNIEKPQIKTIIKEIIKKNSTKPEIFDKIIRCGFELESSNRLVFLNKINAGAKIYSSSEIELFGETFGQVICDGDYMIVKKAQKGVIIFNNQSIDEITKLSIITKNGIKELE